MSLSLNSGTAWQVRLPPIPRQTWRPRPYCYPTDYDTQTYGLERRLDRALSHREQC